MATVIMHAVVSVDGFIADENDGVGPLFEWYSNGDRSIADETGEQRHAPFRVSGRSHKYVGSFWGSIGATVQGRHLFDMTNGWEAEPPAGEHLIVVSHRPKPEGWHPEADVPFFDDVAAAVEEAKRRAGDRVVAVCAGDVGGQALAAGLVTRWRWTSCRSCSARARGTSARWIRSTCSRIRVMSSRATGSSTCAIGSAAENARRRRGG
jgi:dihydrofolate reductase